MRNIVITIAYDGTDFCGWQVQPNGNSIAAEIIKAIERITQETVKLYGSGRTDAGVHAYAQVANFYTEASLTLEKWIGALNAYLPETIAVIAAREEDMNFNARFSAKGKIYKYRIYNSRYPSPFMVNRAWRITYSLDMELKKQAAEILCGEHDFKAFMAAGSSVTDTVRTIYELDITKQDDLIEVQVKGNGFLYNMVRIIVGTLVHVGSGKITCEDLRSVLESQDRTKGAVTAPAYGLYLKEVFYS